MSLAEKHDDAPAMRFAKDHLKAFVERVERLEEEKKTIADDIRDVYAEAKANGFDTKALRAIVKLRKQDVDERKEQEADRKAEEVERLGEQIERRESELRRGTLRTAQMQKLGRGVDAKSIPTTAAASEAAKPSVEATFLHRLHKGACSTFGTVLGPEANEAHRNHFHFDLAPRRRKAFCE